MKSKPPETFEDALYRKANSLKLNWTARTGWKINVTPLVDAVLAAHTTALEAAKREARLDEQELTQACVKELKRICNENDHPYMALAAVEKAVTDRLVQLSYPNQPKQEGGGE